VITRDKYLSLQHEELRPTWRLSQHTFSGFDLG